MQYDWNDEPNRGIGQFIIVAAVSFAIGLYKYGLSWYGMKAILLSAAVTTIFCIGAYLLEVILDSF